MISCSAPRRSPGSVPVLHGRSAHARPLLRCRAPPPLSLSAQPFGAPAGTLPKAPGA